MEKTKSIKYKIFVTDIGVELEVSKATYYKIFNNEVGKIVEDGYEINSSALKKYKKLYNKVRGM